MPRFLTLFSFFLVAAGSLASCGYVVLASISGPAGVFGGALRMPLYQREKPFQYIAIVVGIYALVATLGVLWWPTSRGWKRFAVIFGIVFVTLSVACVPGGVLWTVHDMQAGFFPSGDRFWKSLFQGAMSGIEYGWLVVAASVPYNLCGLVLGYLVTWYGFKVGGSCPSCKLDRVAS